MSAAAALLSAPVRQLSRSAYGAIVKPARGFQVFRIDGYSWTKTLPAGECLTSGFFSVGGRNWCIDYFPNGTDRSSDSDTDAISVYLRIGPTHHTERVRVSYKFNLLDAAGVAAYELPAATGVVRTHRYNVASEEDEDAVLRARVGLAEFVAKEEIERRREALLKDDCLAIRCDVGVTELGALTVAPKENHNASHYNDDYSDWDEGEGTSRRRRQHKPLDDKEYIRRSLAKNRGGVRVKDRRIE